VTLCAPDVIKIFDIQFWTAGIIKVAIIKKEALKAGIPNIVL